LLGSALGHHGYGHTFGILLKLFNSGAEADSRIWQGLQPAHRNVGQAILA
jgi:hypothetical protein